MPVPVRYYCPRCETVVTLQRDAELADKSVTPFPLEGWDYAPVGGDYDAADGVRIVCGEGDTDGEGCGEPYYLNFLRYEDGEAVEPPRPADLVDLAAPTRGPDWPRSP
jgi:hypothetical protein